MPAVSKKQQRYFGYLLSNPDERKKRGISKKAAKDFAQHVKEGEIADKLRQVVADMKAADRKAGLLPGGKEVIDLDVERQRRRKKKVDEEKKSCPEGQYYCFDMGKCRPIPKGHKVREDGELVKEDTIDIADPHGNVKKARGAVAKKQVAAYNKGREVVQSVKDTARKVKQVAKRKVRRVALDVADRMSEEKMTPMQDNNLFGNAYAGSTKLQREKKKAIENIPHKSSETYKRNLQNKTPIDPRESVEIHDARGNLAAEVIDIIKPQPMNVPDSPVKWKELTEAQLPKRNGSIIDCYLGWRGKNYMIKMFFPQSRTRKPTKEEVNSQLQKVYPGAKLWDYQVSDYEPGAPLLQVD